MNQAIKSDNYESFMGLDISDYSGEWISICDGKIVSHGHNLKKVVEESTRKCGSKKFLLARVPSEDTMIL